MAVRNDCSKERGEVMYVPKNVLDKLFNIKKSRGRKRNVDAWDDLVFYSDVGMNVDDFYSGLFGRRK